MSPSPSSGGAGARVLVLATGGTIASRTQNGRKVYPGGGDLISGLPARVPRQAAVAFEEVASIGSQDMSLAVWRTLRRRIGAAFADGVADAVVVTHGTDTLEETAFLLDCVIPPGPAVVLVGAMRPADAADTDGPANLADALAVAVDPASRDRGVLLAMAGRIHGARDLRKAVVDGAYAFESSGTGALGEIVGGKPRFFHPPRPSGLAGRLSLPEAGALPAVAILHAAADMDCDGLGLGSARISGVVAAGFGHGNLPQPVIRTLARLAQDGVRVVRSSRIAGDRVDEDGEVDDAAHGFVVSRALSPEKSRLLLQLMLAAGHPDRAYLQHAFDIC
jgi:L-asparaginase